LKLEEQLRRELIAAVKAKDKVKIQTLRFSLAQIKDAQIEKRGVLTDAEVVKVLQRIAKQRDEAIEAFTKGGREDLVAKETQEKEILAGFLPTQLSRSEIESAVDQVLGKTKSPNFGQVMGQVMQQVGSADGKLVAQVVEQKLKAKPSEQ